MSSNKWLFFANDGLNGLELWITDGTDGGTKLLKDIYPGAGSSTMTRLLDLGNGKITFAGNEGVHGAELWVTDGTANGTFQLKNLDAGDPYGSDPVNLLALGNGKAVFTTTVSRLSKYGELWVTDGTAAGTNLVKDIYAGTSGSAPTQFTAFGTGKAAFIAWDINQGYEMWISDGTSAGTKILEEFGYSQGSGSPYALTSLGNGKMVFSAYDSVNGQELWVTNGTAAGTGLLKNIAEGSANSIFQPNFTILANGKAVFSANDGTHGTELWITNGTAAGTTLLKDINPGSGGSITAHFHQLNNGKTVFAANDGVNTDFLWITDGTAAGTHLVTDVKVYQDSFFTLDNGDVMFVGIYAGRTGLWITDGTAAGTEALLANFGVGDASGNAQFTPLGNGKVVFVADGGWPYVRELWVTDGTAAGTMMVKDITTGLGNSSTLGNFTSFGNGFAGFASDYGQDQFWITDGTEEGTVMAEDYAAAFGKLALLQGSERLGTSGNDTLIGDSRANTLYGLDGKDMLVGGAGKDKLIGGAGKDIFVFNKLTESGITAATRDVITDFTRSQDKIDLSTLDANTATAINNAFTSIIDGAKAFTAAGQLKVVNGVLYGNTDADATAEFAIELTGITNLSTADFVL